MADVHNIEKILYEWDAPERSYQKKDKDFWITAIALLILVSVILFFVKEFLLIVALISILFLYYVLSTVPPQMIHMKISNKAVYFGEVRYLLGDLENFCFKKNLSSEQILFGTMLRFPRQIAMVIDETDKETIKSIVEKRIPYVENPPAFIDKLTKWFADRLPLDKNNKSQEK